MQKLNSWRNKLFILQIGILLSVIEIWINRRSFVHCHDRLDRLIKYFPRIRNKAGSHQIQAHHIAEFVETANRCCTVYQVDCLSRSLALHFLLRRHSIPSRLFLGIRHITGKFEGHAWVEHDGTPLNESRSVKDIYTVVNWFNSGGEKHLK